MAQCLWLESVNLIWHRRFYGSKSVIQFEIPIANRFPTGRLPAEVECWAFCLHRLRGEGVRCDFFKESMERMKREDGVNPSRSRRCNRGQNRKSTVDQQAEPVGINGKGDSLDDPEARRPALASVDIPSRKGDVGDCRCADSVPLSWIRPHPSAPRYCFSSRFSNGEETFALIHLLNVEPLRSSSCWS